MAALGPEPRSTARGCDDCATIKMNFGRRKCVPPTPEDALVFSRWLRFRGRLAGARSGDEGRKMRAKPSCRPSALSAAMARRSAILLGGTAAIALAITQPASAITITDNQVGNPDFVNGTNQFPSVVTFIRGSGTDTQQWCTGTLIDSRTV